MHCRHISVGDQPVIVCGGPKPKPCSECGRASTQLCDWKIGNGKTCDAALCGECSMVPAPDKDLCPHHAKTWAFWQANPA